MAFSLVIECSKDISKLEINFTDGTSMATAPPDRKVSKKPKVKTNPKTAVPDSGIKNTPKREDFIDTDADFEHVSQEVIELPSIIEPNREVKIASELQNLDI